MNSKILSAVLALMAFVFPWVGQAGTQADLEDQANCNTRPLSDFLDGQGTSSSFFPPVADYLGWVDQPGFETFALVDYAGLANNYITDEAGMSLGTRSTGRILECELADGRAKVSVVLNTSKALGFAQSIQALIACGFDPNFLCAPTNFGATAQDVVDYGAEPAVGPAHLSISFVIAAPGDPLPDLIDVVSTSTVTPYVPVTLSFRSTTVGKLPDGTRARLKVQQVAATDAEGNLVYSREIVDLNK